MLRRRPSSLNLPLSPPHAVSSSTTSRKATYRKLLSFFFISLHLSCKDTTTFPNSQTFVSKDNVKAFIRISREPQRTKEIILHHRFEEIRIREEKLVPSLGNFCALGRAQKFSLIIAIPSIFNKRKYLYSAKRVQHCDTTKRVCPVCLISLSQCRIRSIISILFIIILSYYL